MSNLALVYRFLSDKDVVEFGVKFAESHFFLGVGV